jgi:hypothetical protein
MTEVNIQEQVARFASLKQGEREPVASFKTRFDNQVKANLRAGVPDVSDSTRALEFFFKLDDKRYRRILQYYHNKALDNDANAYPQTITAAYRIASRWVIDEKGQNRGYRDPPELQSAFVTDSALVAKAKATPDVIDKKPSGKERRRRPLSEVTCYCCRAKGHYSRDCTAKPKSEDALYAYGISEGTDSENETAYMTTDVSQISETVLFAADEVLIDSQASVNVFNSKHLLRNIRKCRRPIVLNGVQSGAPGVAIDMEGDFNELGPVFYSEGSSANILSLAQLVVSGGDVRYEAEHDHFTLRPQTSNNLYTFARKDFLGSEGRF